MSNTLLIKNIDETQWDEFVNRHTLGSIYHLSSWKQVIERSFKHITGHHIVIKDHESQNILAGLPVFHVKSWLLGDRLVSAPYAMICNPLIRSSYDIQRINDCLLQLHQREKTNYVEIRTSGDSGIEESLPFSASGGYQMHEVKIDVDPDLLFRSFHKKSVRVLISKARKAALKIQKGEQFNDLVIFYQLLVQSRQRKGLPPIPFIFFESLWKVFQSRGMLTLMLALYQEKVVGGLLLLEHKDTLIAEYGCDLIEYRKFGVNQYLDWKAIKLAQTKGIRKYNFGRTSNSNQGLIRYKKNWATQTISLPTYYYPAKYASEAGNSESSRKYKLANKIFQNAPPIISRFLGNFLYRHKG